MDRPNPNPNDPDYDWVPDQIPGDLVQYYRQVKPGYWGYVCPCCKYIYPPGLAGMPGSFRTHIRDYLHDGGCFFNPKAKAVSRTSKHANQAKNF